MKKPGPSAASVKAASRVLGWALLLGAASLAIPSSVLACIADNECASGLCRKAGDLPTTPPIAGLMTGQCVPAGQIAYVDNSAKGSDTNPGTQAMPFQTVAKAMMAGKPYISVAASATKYPAVSVSSGNFVMVGPGRDLSPTATFDSITVSGGALVVAEAQVTPMLSAAAVTCSGASSSVSLVHTIITNTSGRGVDASATCGQLTVERSRVTGTRYGIIIAGTVSTPVTYRIVNTAVTNSGNMASGELHGVYLDRYASGYFAFNTLNNNNRGINCTTGQMISDSIVTGTGPANANAVDSCTAMRVVTANVDIMAGPEPKLLDTAKNATCCIDKAIPDASAPKVDYYGTSRPQGAAYDIGYFEVPGPFTVTPSAGLNGTISPATPQTVTGGATTSFTVTPSTGYTAAVGGTCGGTLTGVTYTTHPITADCTVVATFTGSYAITTVANPNGGGTVSCMPNPVTSGSTSTCTAVPAAGYGLSSISGCGGTAGSASPYATGPITAACTVTANFTTNSVNGACGSAKATQNLFAPSSNLCNTGTATTVASAAGQYSWICNGANGGTTASCNAFWASTPSGGKASASASGANCTAQSGNISAAASAPSNLRFPEGVLSFTLSGCTPGATAMMTVQYTNALSTGAKYYKQSGTSWSLYPGATVGGNTVTFGIADNGAQDSNPSPGTITDPSGPAIDAANPPPPPASVAAPALSPLTLFLLTGLLAGAAWTGRRRSPRS